MRDEHKKNQYEDIICLPHHVSDVRPHMPIPDRAAQFSPFAALTGFEGAISESARLTDQRIELDETQKAVLDEKLQQLQRESGKNHEVEIVYFIPDKMKSGGAYSAIQGIVKKMDGYERALILQDGTRILIDDIIEITGNIFSGGI